jgi:hypothetical protein
MSNDDRDLVIETVDRLRGHAFYPPEAEWNEVPKLYATEDVLTENKIVHLHYFVGGADWWIVEVEHDTRVAFGFACLGDPANAEWGYVALDELAALHKSMTWEWAHEPPNDEPTETVVVPTLIVERDLYWTKRPAGEVDGIKVRWS